MTLKMIKNEGTKNEQSIDIIVSDNMAGKIIDLLYPNPGITGESKGYITLVNFLLKD